MVIPLSPSNVIASCFLSTERRFNFQKYEHGQADSLGARYDYGSIMHYPMYAFTNNGRATIVPKDANAEIGQRVKLSKIDIQQINKLYKCKATTPAPSTHAPTPAPTPAACADQLDVCYYYAYFGYCSYYKHFMSINCRRSCNYCWGNTRSINNYLIDNQPSYAHVLASYAVV